MIPCPGSNTLPHEVNQISFSGACRCCGIRFERMQMLPVTVVSPGENGVKVKIESHELIPFHSPGSHHQEI